MTSTAHALPDSAPLGRDLLARVKEQRAIAEDAERAILCLAVEWAIANPVLPGHEAWRPTPEQLHPSDLVELDPADEGQVREDDVMWAGIPEVAWDAPAAFAAANGMGTAAGKAVMRDGLVLALRAPRTWRLLGKKCGTARQARQVAEALLSQPDDVCDHVDAEVSRRIRKGHSVGRVVVARLVDEAMLRMHAEERELAQLDALDRRHVTVDPATINHTGIGALEAHADWADLAAFDETLSGVATALKEQPEYEHESLDVRRSAALGVLADPARALALLQDTCRLALLDAQSRHLPLARSARTLLRAHT